MIEIEVKKQKQLTFRETLDFCISSIRHRFARSLLTLAVIVLAVAFFMFLQCSNIFRNSVKAGVEQEIIQSRMPSRLLGMLYTPFTINEFTKLLVDSRNNPGDKIRFSRVLNIPADKMNGLLENAFSELYYLNFFANDLTIGRRKELFGRLEGGAVLDYLVVPENFQKTQEKMLKMGGVRFPGGNEKLRSYLNDYPQYRKEMSAAFNSWVAFQKSLKNDKLSQNDAARIRSFLLKAAADPVLLKEWTDKLSAHGFTLTEKELDAVLYYQTMSDQIEKVQTVLSLPEYRKKWRRLYGQSKYIKMDEKLTVLDSQKTMNLLKGAPYPGGVELTDEQMRGIADEFRQRKKLRDLEVYLDINLFDTNSGFSPSQLYLMALSFLVCVVGITNAMLMSITERFREIATLKCLGATDSFILFQIVLEAMIQGCIGSVIGILLGFLVAMFNSFFQVGSRIFTTFDFEMIGFAALFSLIAGLLLSILAALYPSSRAARMAPMEAMRVE